MTCACYDCEACMQQGRLVTARLACTRPRSETVGTQTLRAHVFQPQEMVAAVDMCVQRFRSLRADFGLRLRATTHDRSNSNLACAHRQELIPRGLASNRNMDCFIVCWCPRRGCGVFCACCTVLNNIVALLPHYGNFPNWHQPRLAPTRTGTNPNLAPLVLGFRLCLAALDAGCA